ARHFRTDPARRSRRERRRSARRRTRPQYLDSCRSNRRAADPKTTRLGLQRRGAREEGMSDGFEGQFEEMQPSSQSNSQPPDDTLPPSATFEDFASCGPSRMCIYRPCKTMWPNASIDDRLPPMPLLDPRGNPVLNSRGKVVMIPASERLAKYRSVVALTWDPGKPEFIHNCVVVDGGYIEKLGATTYNFYRPPPDIKLGDPAQAARWVEHWRAIYPNDADHIIAWLACRVQHPGI